LGRPRANALGWATGFALLTAALGCGAGGPEDWPSGRPRIDRLRFLQQEPTAPADLQFALEFVDGDGDLAGGELELFIQERSTATRSLAELFDSQSPPMAPDVTRGTLEFVARLQPDIPVGATVRVGVELIDGAGRRSNQPSVELRVVGEENGP